MTEPATSRDRIRAEIAESLSGLDSIVWDMLAIRIDEALFGPPDGPWVGPLLTAEQLGEITGPHRGCERVVLGPGQRPCSVLRLARHIGAQSTTIRNQNEIMAAQASLIERWRVDLDVSDPEQVVVLARSEHEALIADLESLRSEVRRLLCLVGEPQSLDIATYEDDGPVTLIAAASNFPAITATVRAVRPAEAP